ncbi:MAG: hypothetical protein RR772_09005 [Gordonibacter sp.]
MKKSNWIIAAVLALGAGFFLWLWYYLGFNFVDDPLDLVIAIVWWAVVLSLVFGIRFVEKKRQQRVRTTYLAPGKLFNSEAGLVDLAALEEGMTVTDALEGTLSELKYSFDRTDLPERDEVTFDRIVRTEKFDKDDADKWEGEVVDVKTQQASPFKGKEELASLLAA